MQANRSRDTGPELAVRRLLHAHGFRYRVSARPLPALRRQADIVFPKKRIAIFIDGCFWHGCPEHGRAEFRHNTQYWPAKIETNRVRDEETNRLLEDAGWTVLRYWEHEDPVDVVTRIETALH
jgi:DNA mismatch endonuclease, patch repair protein